MSDMLRNAIEYGRRRDRFTNELRGLLHAHGFSVNAVDIGSAEGVRHHQFAAFDPKGILATWYVPFADGREMYDSRAARETATRVAGAWLRMREAPDTAQAKWHGFVA